MRRLLLGLSAAALIVGLIATPEASAQRVSTRPSAEQSVNFFIGGFNPRSLDARGTNDVLFQNGDFLTFDFKEFNGPTIGAGWTVGLGDMFDAGIDVGFYQRTAPAVYTFFTNKNDTEIEQDLKLRIVPVTATIRFLPLGHHGPARPYIGAGVGIFSWRYSESGQFLADDNSIFRSTFEAKGTKAGPVVLGGILLPIGAGGIGGEIRYQAAKADLPSSDWPAGTKLDLGGLNYLFMINIRF